MESMSRTPYYLENARSGYRLWDGKVIDGMVHDGLWDVVNDYHMGYTADIQSKKFSISRKEQDQFAYESNMKALEAIREGKFKEEILSLSIPSKKGPPTLFEVDEGPREPIFSMAKLKPAFTEDGVVTAGNSSKISDGASALVLMAKEKAQSLGILPMAESWPRLLPVWNWRTYWSPRFKRSQKC
jgi:acetyl-CoA C-acetyltransferase